MTLSGEPESIRISTLHSVLPLRETYSLSFADLEAFESIYVIARRGRRRGLGEVTPLPGYSSESIDTVDAELARISADWTHSAGRLVDELSGRAPFLASGIACAMETLEDEEAWAGLGAPISLAGTCGGATPVQAAREADRLCRAGYKVIKLKIGHGSVDVDLQRARAVSAAVPAGVRLRLDANQKMSFEGAAAMCEQLAEMPAVQHLEQPFATDAWDDTRRLAAATSVPIMLDESISSSADIDHAEAVGASLVKLKLCKAPGQLAARNLIRHARARGLGVVFGNGVQTALGNHLEARIYLASGLDTAAEFNGFAKLADPLMEGLEVRGGALHDGGLDSSKMNEGAAKVVLESPAMASN